MSESFSAKVVPVSPGINVIATDTPIVPAESAITFCSLVSIVLFICVKIALSVATLETHRKDSKHTAIKSIDKAIENLQSCYDNYEDKPKYVLFEISKQIV